MCCSGLACSFFDCIYLKYLYFNCPRSRSFSDPLLVRQMVYTACSFFEISLVCATCHTFSFHILLSVYPPNVLSRTGPSRDHLPTTLHSEHFHYSSFLPQPVPFFNCTDLACSFFELLLFSIHFA